MIAAAAGHLGIVKYLARAGASLVVPNFAGWTPLHRACFNGHVDVLTFLLDRDQTSDSAVYPSLDVTNHYGSTPLHVAIPNGNKEVVEVLIDAGAPLEARNASGDTPLHFAVICRQSNMVELLLTRGAEASTRNNEGFIPVDTAVATGQHELAAYLRAATAKPVNGDSNRKTSAVMDVKAVRSRPATAPSARRVSGSASPSTLGRQVQPASGRKALTANNGVKSV